MYLFLVTMHIFTLDYLSFLIALHGAGLLDACILDPLALWPQLRRSKNTSSDFPISEINLESLTRLG